MAFMQPLPLQNDPTLSWLYSDRQLLVPVKVDITHSGCRLVDSFCIDVLSPFTSLELAAKTTQDHNLHREEFKWKFAQQIQEQMDAFVSILSALRYRTPELDEKIKKMFTMPQQITIGIRFHTLDYSETILWDVHSKKITPEIFARITCADLQLPPQMEPLISFKIRETLVRTLIHSLDDNETTAPPPIVTPFAPGIAVTTVSVSSAVELITTLWKHAKPSNITDSIGMQRSRLPKNTDSNGFVWTQEKDGTATVATKAK